MNSSADLGGYFLVLIFSFLFLFARCHILSLERMDSTYCEAQNMMKGWWWYHRRFLSNSESQVNEVVPAEIGIKVELIQLRMMKQFTNLLPSSCFRSHISYLRRSRHICKRFVAAIHCPREQSQHSRSTLVNLAWNQFLFYRLPVYFLTE